MTKIEHQLPLYQSRESHATLLNKLSNQQANGSRTFHKGLIYERFFSAYNSKWEITEQKSDWLKKFFKGDAGNKQQLKATLERQHALIYALQGTGEVYTLISPLVTGLGNDHPLENGFLWHPTLATPYLNGAAIKGCLRAWIEQWNPEVLSKEEQQMLFGTDKDPNDASIPCQSGEIIFFDALPIDVPTLPTLQPDVMTPHMGDWYQNGQTKPLDPSTIPADWHQPIPISFLTVTEARFLLTIAPRTKRAKPFLETLISEISQALLNMGIGAKTATGFGYMKTVETSEATSYTALVQSYQQKQRLLHERAQMTPLQKEIDHFFNSYKDNVTDLEALIDRALQENWDTKDKLALAHAIRTRSNYLNISNKKKKKLRPRQEKVASLNILGYSYDN